MEADKHLDRVVAETVVEVEADDKDSRADTRTAVDVDMALAMVQPDLDEHIPVETWNNHRPEFIKIKINKSKIPNLKNKKSRKNILKIQKILKKCL